MDELQRRFAAEIGKRFYAAAESDAKTELIEELSDNLCRRYREALSEGLDEEAAYAAALNGLGDVSELVEYLNGLSPERPGQVDPLDGLLNDLEDITQGVFLKAKSAIEDVKKRLREETLYGSAARQEPPRRDAGDRGRSAARPYSREGLSPEAPFSADSLRGVDVRIANGDVHISFSEPENGSVLFSGSVEELELNRTADGVLLIRQGRTASSSSLFRRGLSCSDVELCLPCRDWEFVQVSTANGDVELEGGCTVASLSVKTATGDIDGRLAGCGELALETASGDMEWTGDADTACVVTISGDISLNGRFGSLTATSVSGDLDTAGSVREARCVTVSGELNLESASLPDSLSLSSKSGDCNLRLPEEPFTVRASTRSGDVDSAFPVQRIPGGYLCGQGGAEYAVSTVSGDVSVEKI